MPNFMVKADGTAKTSIDNAAVTLGDGANSVFAGGGTALVIHAKGDDMTIHTFSLAPAASTKMQQTIDKGGYQYGDKVSVMYDPGSMQAVKVKGKASRPL